MIYRDRVTLKLGGGTDPYGSPLPTRDAAYRAEVWPLTAEEQQGYQQAANVTNYRVALPKLRAGDEITSATKVVWRGLTYDTVGAPMPNTVAGRLHHTELLIKRGTY